MRVVVKHLRICVIVKKLKFEAEPEPEFRSLLSATGFFAWKSMCFLCGSHAIDSVDCNCSLRCMVANHQTVCPISDMRHIAIWCQNRWESFNRKVTTDWSCGILPLTESTFASSWVETAVYELSGAYWLGMDAWRWTTDSYFYEPACGSRQHHEYRSLWMQNALFQCSVHLSKNGLNQWCIAKNAGGYTQRGVAKGLKVPCLFMITEVSIRCQAYTPQYNTGLDILQTGFFLALYTHTPV